MPLDDDPYARGLRKTPSRAFFVNRAWNAICDETLWERLEHPSHTTYAMLGAADATIHAAFPGQDPDDMLQRLLLFAAFGRPWVQLRGWDAKRVLSPVQLRRLIRAYKRENGPDHAIA